MTMITESEFSNYNRLIHRFVFDTIKSNPWIEYQDMVNQSWAILLLVRKRWRHGTKMKFTTFFYQKLKWYRRDLIRSRIREQRATQRFIEMRVGLPTDGIEVEGAARRLCRLVRDQLNHNERRILNLMLFPSVDFRKFLAGEGDQVVRPHSLAMQTCYAKYLGLHRRTASRACAKIGMLLRESINDQEAG